MGLGHFIWFGLVLYYITLKYTFCFSRKGTGFYPGFSHILTSNLRNYKVKKYLDLTAKPYLLMGQRVIATKAIELVCHGSEELWAYLNLENSKINVGSVRKLNSILHLPCIFDLTAFTPTCSKWEWSWVSIKDPKSSFSIHTAQPFVPSEQTTRFTLKSFHTCQCISIKPKDYLTWLCLMSMIHITV